MFFAILYPVIFIIQFWLFATSKENKIFLLERHYSIYEDKIVGTLSDGTDNIIKLEHLIKSIQTKRYFLLYISKNQFIYIPNDSFKNDKDKEWFIMKIIMNIKK